LSLNNHWRGWGSHTPFVLHTSPSPKKTIPDSSVNEVLTGVRDKRRKVKKDSLKDKNKVVTVIINNRIGKETS